MNVFWAEEALLFNPCFWLLGIIQKRTLTLEIS